MTVLQDYISKIERAEALDAVAGPLAQAVTRAVRPRMVRNILSGTNLGHPLHPPLTDVTIGAFSMATLLDLIGGRKSRRAVGLLLGTGIAAAVPTAASGLNDWSDTRGPAARVGLVHASANTTALLLYTGSLLSRLRRRRLRAKVFTLAGFGALVTGGYLGGHLAYSRGVDVNRTAWEHGPHDWTPVLSDADLPVGEHRTVDVDGVHVLLYRDDSSLQALDATCSHMGGPLGEGMFKDGTVTCPWHGSTFAFSDGHILHGPASTPEPKYDTQVRNGMIEIRAVQPA